MYINMASWICKCTHTHIHALLTFMHLQDKNRIANKLDDDDLEALSQAVESGSSWLRSNGNSADVSNLCGCARA